MAHRSGHQRPAEIRFNNVYYVNATACVDPDWTNIIETIRAIIAMRITMICLPRNAVGWTMEAASTAGAVWAKRQEAGAAHHNLEKPFFSSSAARRDPTPNDSTAVYLGHLGPVEATMSVDRRVVADLRFPNTITFITLLLMSPMKLPMTPAPKIEEQSDWGTMVLLPANAPALATAPCLEAARGDQWSRLWVRSSPGASSSVNSVSRESRGPSSATADGHDLAVNVSATSQLPGRHALVMSIQRPPQVRPDFGWHQVIFKARCKRRVKFMT